MSMNAGSWLAHRDYIVGRQADMLAVQESRLTLDGQILVKESLADTSWTPLFGKPQPIRKGTVKSTTDAKQGGVMSMLQKGHRSTATPRGELGQALFETGRWEASTTCIDGTDTLLHTQNVYGYPGANEGGQAMMDNENFFADVFDFAGSLGDDVPVVVIGDFNIRLEQSHVLCQLIASHKWVECGSLLAALSGTEPQPTFESGGSMSRIDMAFLNPAAARLLSSFEVLPIDIGGTKQLHPIRVSFNFSGCHRMAALQTKQIRGIPKTEDLDGKDREYLLDKLLADFLLRYGEAYQAQDVDAMWKQWCELAESYLLEQAAYMGNLDGLLSDQRYRGRGLGATTSEVKVGYKCTTPNAGTVDKDKQLLVKLHNLLTEVLRLLKKDLDETEDFKNCWRKACNIAKTILPASIRTRRIWNQPTLTNEDCEKLLDVVAQVVEKSAEDSRSRTLRRLKDLRNQNSKTDAGALFKAFRDPDQTPLTVIRREDGTLTGNVKEMDKLVRDAWMPIFAKHNEDKPPPSVDKFMQAYGRYIKRSPQECKPITLKELKRVLNKLSASSAGGLDGWTSADLKKLPGRILEQLLLMFDVVEDTGRWPAALCWASVSLIPKGEGGHPLELRPITITPLVYRLWAAVRMKHSHDWQERWVHQGQHGSRKNHGTLNVLAEIAIAFEQAWLDGEDFGGLAVDLAKAFDAIPVDITFAVLESMGVDAGMAAALRGMYSQIQRRFKFGNYVGEAFTSTNGILQGCPLSVMLLNALMSVLSFALSTLGVDPQSYVDDLTLMDSSDAKLQAAMDLLDRYLALTDQKVNTKKTKTFGTHGGAQVWFRGCLLNRTAQEKIVGGIFTFEGGKFSCVRDPKATDKQVDLCTRIRWSGFAFHNRVTAISGLVMSKALYAIEVTDLPEAQARKLKTAVSYAIWQKVGKQFSTGLLFTLFGKGHVNDASQAPHVRRLCGLHRLCVTTPSFMPRISTLIAAMKRKKFGRRGGFVNNLWGSIRALHLQLDTTTGIVISDGNGNAHQLAATSSKQWGHVVRDFSRMETWRRVEKERKRSGDACGIASGINRTQTLRYYNLCRPMRQGVLRRIHLGSVWTNTRLSHQPRLGISRVCSRCNAEDEDLQHLWWRCPAWEDIRARSFYNFEAPDYTSLPRALTTYGLVPTNSGHTITNDTVQRVQSMMADIFAARFSDT